MSLRFILRIFASFFLIATMMGGSQSYAQDAKVPAATPIIENDGVPSVNSRNSEGNSDLPDETNANEAVSPGDVTTMSLISGTSTLAEGRISGLVLSSTGDDTSGATVCQLSTTNCVTVDESGSYTLIVEWPENYQVGDFLTFTASKDGFIPKSTRTNDIQPGQDVHNRWFYLTTISSIDPGPDTSTLSGTLTDAKNVTLPGVELCISQGHGQYSECTITNASGQYRFNHLSREFSEQYQTFFDIGTSNSPWHAYYVAGTDWSWSETGYNTLDLVAQPVDDPYISPQLTGLLIDRNGNPIVDFRVCVGAGKFSSCLVSNGESNRFHVNMLDSLEIRAQGCPNTSIHLPSGIAYDHDFGGVMLDCEAGVAPITTSIVSGKVTYLDGSPAAGVTVSLTSEVAASGLFAFATNGYTTTTAADGTYAFSDVIDGSYTISVAAGPGFGDKQQITVAGEDVTANLVLRYSNVSVAGTVKDKDGQPVAGARVCLNQVCVDTDANGVYALGSENGPIGKHTISASADGFAPQSQPLFILGDMNAMSVNFQLVAAIGTETPTEAPTSTAPATGTPTSTAPATEIPTGTVVPTGTASTTPEGSGTTTPGDSGSDRVTSLPSTGTGTMNGTLIIAALLAIAASSLLLAGGLAVRQRRG